MDVKSCPYHSDDCENGFELALIKKEAERTGDMFSAFSSHIVKLFWLYHPYVWRDASNEREILCGTGLGWITDEQGDLIRQSLISLTKTHPARFQNVSCKFCKEDRLNIIEIDGVIVCETCGANWK